MPVAVTVVAVGVSLALIAWLTLRPYTDVLDLTASKFSLWSGAILSLLFLVLTVLAGGALLYRSATEGGWYRTLAGVSFLLPVTMVAVLVWRSGRQSIAVSMSNQRALAALGVEASAAAIERMAVRKEVRIAVGARGEGPKLIPGLRRSTLLLPRTLDADLSRLTQNPTQRQALAHYVILHELAHVTNGDSYAFSLLARWVELLLRYWVGPHLVVLAVWWHFSGGSETTVVGTLGFMLLAMAAHAFPLGALVAVMAHGIRQREYLADARAILHLSDDERRQLFQPGNEEVVGHALRYFGLKASAALGLGLSERVGADEKDRWKSRGLSALSFYGVLKDLVGRRVSLHPMARERTAAAVAESWINPSTAGLTVQEAFLMGAVAAFIVWYGGVAVGAVARRLLALNSNPPEPLLAATIVAIGYVYAMNWLPVRAAWTGSIDAARMCKNMLRATAVATAVAVGIFSLFPLLSYGMIAEAPKVSWASLVALAMLGAVIVGCGGGLAMLSLLGNEIATQLRSTWDLNVQRRTSKWRSGSNTVLILASAPFLLVFDWHYVIVGFGSGALLHRMLVRAVDDGSDPWVNRVVKLSLGKWHWLFEGPKEIKFFLAVVGWSRVALAFVAMFVFSTLIPERYAWGIFALASGVFFVILLSGRGKRRQDYEATARFLYWSGRLRRSVNTVDCAAAIARRVTTVESAHAAGEGFNLQEAASDQPLLPDSVRVAMVRWWWRGQEPERPLVDWVLKCEGPTGGFAPWPGRSSRLWATYEAIQFLREVGQPELDSARHVEWLWGLQGEDGRFRESPSDEANVVVDALVVDSLSKRGAVERDRLGATAEAALREWRSGSKGFLETHATVSVLSTSGYLSDDHRFEFIETWLKPMTLTARCLRPAVAIEEIVRYLEIAAMLRCHDPEFEQVRFRVEKHVERALLAAAGKGRS